MVKLRSTITTYFVVIAIYLVLCFLLSWRFSWWIMGVASVPILILALWGVPKVQTSSLSAKGVTAEAVFKAENDARATLAQIIGGFAVLVGLYVAWQNLKENISTTAKNIELTNKNLQLTREGQVTERFTKAIEQLGATDDQGRPKLELRLGGIFALERIATDSERDHWPIMEVLTTYVRDNSPRTPSAGNSATNISNPLATDIQAIMRVIAAVT